MTGQTVERKEMPFSLWAFQNFFFCPLHFAGEKTTAVSCRPSPESVWHSSRWIMNGRNLSAQHYSYEKGNPGLKLKDRTVFIGKDTIWLLCWGTFIHIRWMRQKNSLTGAKQTKFTLPPFLDVLTYIAKKWVFNWCFLT